MVAWRDPFGGHGLVDARCVQADRLHLAGALLAEGVEELVERGLAAVLADPHHPAGVVVGHDGQVAVPALVGDLVHPDPVQPVQAAVVDVVGHHPADDVVDCLPRATQQLRHAGLVHPLRQPAGHILEVAGMPGTRPRPPHLLGAHSSAAVTVHPMQVGLQEHLAGAEVQVPPTPPGRVVAESGTPPARTGKPGAPAA
jgi:hypothetical protein